MKEIILTIFALLVVGGAALATPQAGTPLRLNGTNHYVYGFALRPDMSRAFQRNRDKLTAISSANWKGYYVKLEVRKKQLYLASLDVERSNNIKDPNMIKAGQSLSIPRETERMQNKTIDGD